MSQSASEARCRGEGRRARGQSPPGHEEGSVAGRRFVCGSVCFIFVSGLLNVSLESPLNRGRRAAIKDFHITDLKLPLISVSMVFLLMVYRFWG